MSRRVTDTRVLLLASVLVLAVAAGIAATFYSCLSRYPAASNEPPSPWPDAAPPPAPSAPGTECSRDAVKRVRAHPGIGDVTIEKAALRRLEQIGIERGEKLRVVGWRGREDQDQHTLCRVSLRFLIGEERGASVWLVDLEAAQADAIEPLDTLSIEVTQPVPLDDPGAEAKVLQACRTKGVELVQHHFSYLEEHGIWTTMRKRAAEERRDTGTEIVWGEWTGRPEGARRCLVSLGYTEDGTAKTEYWRLRWLANDEHAVEPLTPRAIEAIYGPGVYTR